MIKKTFCFLCADARGRYVHMRITGTKDSCINRLENAGLEVCEDQTEDYLGDPQSEWVGTILLRELKDTDYVPHD